MTRTVLIAAPSSGSGKTSVTMGLIRALVTKGQSVSAIKIGPDYIDSGWHAMAAKERCWNIDPWAMRESTQNAILARATTNVDWCIIEGVMGLYDGAIDGRGSSFDFASRFNIPIILVVDASRQADSIAALVSGFHHYKGHSNIAGVILNRVGSERHDALLKRALAPLKIPVLASLNYSEKALIGSRHLGLYQAGEQQSDEEVIDELAHAINSGFNFAQIDTIAAAPKLEQKNVELTPLFFGDKKRIAIAEDAAFRFIYRHFLEAWLEHGIELQFFSILNGEDFDDADAIYIPGGYPELYLEQISASSSMLKIKNAHKSGVAIYGECGGYMVLGHSIVDKNGDSFEMAGILRQITSLRNPKRALGYRHISPLQSDDWRFKHFRGHEFHYSQSSNSASSLFVSNNALMAEQQHCGDKSESAMGSYLHLIDANDR